MRTNLLLLLMMPLVLLAPGATTQAAERTLALDLAYGAKLELVLIPKGTFQQGSPLTEPNAAQTKPGARSPSRAIISSGSSPSPVSSSMPSSRTLATAPRRRAAPAAALAGTGRPSSKTSASTGRRQASTKAMNSPLRRSLMTTRWHSAIGFPARPAGRSPCPPKRNGNTPAVPAPPRPGTMATTRCTRARSPGSNSTRRIRPTRSAQSIPMPGGSASAATLMSGAATGMGPTRPAPSPTRNRPTRTCPTSRAAYCAAAPGCAKCSTPARRLGIATHPPAGMPTTASVW